MKGKVSKWKKVRLGIIGIGSGGNRSCRQCVERDGADMELTAVADIRQSRLTGQGTIFRRRLRYLMMAGK